MPKRFYRSIAILLMAGAIAASAPSSERLVVDANGASTPFPHFWEKTFGSGRAILSLRESYRNDLRTEKAATNFESIRFHGILMDEVGVYDPGRRIQHPDAAEEDTNDPSIYNFSYVDQIYDGLLSNHVKPFVELSFMPARMASGDLVMQNFWYRPVVAPPKDYKVWDALIAAFARHLIVRYGEDEVASWKFEVWNEPNIEFWAGNPKQGTYFELYDHTARTLKAVSPRIQVGGPATARAAWVTPFLEYAKTQGTPVDFVSTHIYANDDPFAVLGVHEEVSRDQMVYRAVKMVHDQIYGSAFPKLPLIISEYNASWRFDPNITDSVFMGPWLANNIRLCDGLTDRMAYWDFSDVFEELGVVRTQFYGGYGLIAAESIPKPTLNIFAALHKLGQRRIQVASSSVLATTTEKDIALALWNYAPPNGEGPKHTKPANSEGSVKKFDLEIKGLSRNALVEIWRIDEDHSNVLKAFDAMGRPPADLTQEQIARLRVVGSMSPPEYTRLTEGQLHLTVPAHGLAVVLIDRGNRLLQTRLP